MSVDRAGEAPRTRFKYTAPIDLGDLTVALTRIEVSADEISVSYVAHVRSMHLARLAYEDFEVLGELSGDDGRLETVGTSYSRQKDFILWEGEWTFRTSVSSLIPSLLTLDVYIYPDEYELGKVNTTLQILTGL